MMEGMFLEKEMAGPVQAQVIHHIKDIIEAYCNLEYDTSEDRYKAQIYAGYQDHLDHSTIKKIFSQDNPGEALDELLWDFFCDYDNYDEIIHEIKKRFDDNAFGLLYGDFEDFIRDWISCHVSFDYPYDHYLNQDINVDIIVDTGDENYDYTLNCVYPHYNGRFGETISKEASVVWLAKQQGYNKRQLNKALMRGEFGGSEFLKSMREEVLNCSTHMNALAFFLKMPLKQCFELLARIESDSARDDKSGCRTVPKRRGKDFIIISKDAACGLYDCWNGSGGLLAIVLEKDVRIPLKYISTSLPDGCRGYGIGEIYGEDDSPWKADCVTITKKSLCEKQAETESVLAVTEESYT